MCGGGYRGVHGAMVTDGELGLAIKRGERVVGLVSVGERSGGREGWRGRVS